MKAFGSVSIDNRQLKLGNDQIPFLMLMKEGSLREIKCLCLFVIVSFLLNVNVTLGKNANYRITPPPEWVAQQKAQYDIQEKDKSSTSGYYYLLVSRQENLAREQMFVHYTVKILSAEGLQEASDLSIEFDPGYQKLTLHKIDIVRRKRAKDQLDSLPIKFVQRETSMERHIYDGRLTAVINLKDVRVGDIIDYSYSITGYNPVFAGHYSNEIYLQYGVPINHIYYRLITPKEKKLQFKYHNGENEPSYHQSGDSNIYFWERKNVPALLYDINTPSWYDPYPRISVSDYPSWSSVADWALTLFSISESERDRLRATVKDIIKPQSIDTTIIQAIRLVQDEMRYLAFVDGLYSHTPHPPTKVLKQRYGDCKDKSLLLCEILKLYGIDAFPVLVHSRNGPALEKSLPSPDAFNHCVVYLRKDDKEFFIDPTISNQGGDLEHFYFPNYYKGLIIKEEGKSLVSLPLSNYSSIQVKDMFKIDDVGKGGASLHISKAYSGSEADYQRQYFASTNLQSIQKEYLDFYSRMYPQIKADKEIKVIDHRDGNNTLTVQEFYIIASMWDQYQNDEDMLYCEFYPLMIYDYVSVTKSPQRTMPYLVHFPVHIEHETIVRLPETWTIENDKSTIESESFMYHSVTDYEDKTLRLFHLYETLQGHIEAEKVDSFVKKHDQILDNLSYVLTYDEGLAGERFRFSWPAGVAGLIILIISGYLAARLYNNYDLPISIDSTEGWQIGGWLTLVAIGLALAPIRIGYEAFIMPEYYNSSVWSSLFDFNASTRNLLTGLLMIVELVYNLVLFVFSVLMVFLFFNRRTILPRFIIIFYSTILLFLIIDTFIAFSLNPDAYTDAEKTAMYGDIVRAFITSAIWIPYFLHSKRVKETFVKRSPRNQKSAVPEVPLPESSIGLKPKRKAIRYAIWITAVIVIVAIIIGFSFLFSDSRENNMESTNKTLFPEWQNTALPDTEFNLDTSSFGSGQIQNWKYVILQCQSKRDGKISLGIIAVNDRAVAYDILNRLRAGASFSLIAMQESGHPSKEIGGYLGSFKMADLNEKFQAALKGIGEGENTDVIEITNIE